MAPSQAEAYLGCQTSSPSPLATQNLSLSSLYGIVAVNQQSSIVLLDAVTLKPQQALHCPQHATTHPDASSSSTTTSSIINGVAISPSGRHVAAYTQQQLLLSGIAAAAPSTDLGVCQSQHKGDAAGAGRLHAAALLPSGIRSVHWSPAAAGLAVCSRNEPSVQLYTLAGPPAAPSQHQQQQLPAALSPGGTAASGHPLPEQQARHHLPAGQLPSAALQLVLTLPGPQTLTKGPTAATWLQQQTAPCGTSSNDSGSGCSSSGTSGSSGGCSSGGGSSSAARQHSTTVGLLVAWPTHLLLFTWHASKQGVINWSSYSTHDILTGWPGPPKTLLQLQPQAAAAAVAAGDSGSNDGSSSSSVQQSVQVVALVEPAGPGWQAAAGYTAADAAGYTGAAAAGGGGAANGVGSTTTAGSVSALMEECSLKPGRSLLVEPISASAGPIKGAASSSSSSSSVLDSLMNITAHQEQQQPQPVLLATAAIDASSSQDCSKGVTPHQAASYLCLLTLDLQRLTINQAQHSSSGSRDSHSSQTSQAVSLAQDACRHSTHVTSRQALTSGATVYRPPSASLLLDGSGSSAIGSSANGSSADGGAGPAGFVSVLPLQQQPLARFLATHGSLVAVGSSTGAPCVTVCAVSASQGLQALQTIELQLPKRVTAAISSSSSGKQARLQGLLLVPSGHTARSCTSASTSTAAAAAAIDISVVALLACSEKPSGAAACFGGFGGIRGGQQGRAADLYVVRTALGAGVNTQQPSEESSYRSKVTHQQQQQQQQQQQPAAGPTQPVKTLVVQAGSLQGQQGAVAAAASGSQAVVAALQALQISLEGRLDTMQATLDRMENRLAALEQRQP